jgi:hypothetical protein
MLSHSDIQSIQLGKQLVTVQFPRGEPFLYRNDLLQFNKTRIVGPMSSLDQFPFVHQFTKIGGGLIHRVVLVEGVGDDVGDSQLPGYG